MTTSKLLRHSYGKPPTSHSTATVTAAAAAASMRNSRRLPKTFLAVIFSVLALDTTVLAATCPVDNESSVRALRVEVNTPVVTVACIGTNAEHPTIDPLQAGFYTIRYVPVEIAKDPPTADGECVGLSKDPSEEGKCFPERNVLVCVQDEISGGLVFDCSSGLMILAGTGRTVISMGNAFHQGPNLTDCAGCGGRLFPIKANVVSAVLDSERIHASYAVDAPKGNSSTTWTVLVASHNGLIDYISSGCTRFDDGSGFEEPIEGGTLKHCIYKLLVLYPEILENTTTATPTTDNPTQADTTVTPTEAVTLTPSTLLRSSSRARIGVNLLVPIMIDSLFHCLP